jgi:hypothetical protein
MMSRSRPTAEAAERQNEAMKGKARDFNES